MTRTRAALSGCLVLLAGRFVELAPGAALRRDLGVGPVNTAGRYDIHAGVVDLAHPLLVPGPGTPPPPIEALGSIRFEP